MFKVFFFWTCEHAYIYNGKVYLCQHILGRNSGFTFFTARFLIFMYYNDKNPINLNYHIFITERVDYWKQTAVSLNVIGCWFMIERSSSSNKSFFCRWRGLVSGCAENTRHFKKTPKNNQRYDRKIKALLLQRCTLRKYHVTDGQNTPD